MQRHAEDAPTAATSSFPDAPRQSSRQRCRRDLSAPSFNSSVCDEAASIAIVATSPTDRSTHQLKSASSLSHVGSASSGSGKRPARAAAASDASVAYSGASSLNDAGSVAPFGSGSQSFSKSGSPRSPPRTRTRAAHQSPKRVERISAGAATDRSRRPPPPASHVPSSSLGARRGGGGAPQAAAHEPGKSSRSKLAKTLSEEKEGHPDPICMAEAICTVVDALSDLVDAMSSPTQMRRSEGGRDDNNGSHTAAATAATAAATAATTAAATATAATAAATAATTTAGPASMAPLFDSTFVDHALDLLMVRIGGRSTRRARGVAGTGAISQLQRLSLQYPVRSLGTLVRRVILELIITPLPPEASFRKQPTRVKRFDPDAGVFVFDDSLFSSAVWGEVQRRLSSAGSPTGLSFTDDAAAAAASTSKDLDDPILVQGTLDDGNVDHLTLSVLQLLCHMLRSCPLERVRWAIATLAAECRELQAQRDSLQLRGSDDAAAAAAVRFSPFFPTRAPRTIEANAFLFDRPGRQTPTGLRWRSAHWPRGATYALEGAVFDPEKNSWSKAVEGSRAGDSSECVLAQPSLALPQSTCALNRRVQTPLARLPLPPSARDSPHVCDPAAPATHTLFSPSSIAWLTEYAAAEGRGVRTSAAREASASVPVSVTSRLSRRCNTRSSSASPASQLTTAAAAAAVSACTGLEDHLESRDGADLAGLRGSIRSVLGVSSVFRAVPEEGTSDSRSVPTPVVPPARRTVRMAALKALEKSLEQRAGETGAAFWDRIHVLRFKISILRAIEMPEGERALWKQLWARCFEAIHETQEALEREHGVSLADIKRFGASASRQCRKLVVPAPSSVKDNALCSGSSASEQDNADATTTAATTAASSPAGCQQANVGRREPSGAAQQALVAHENRLSEFKQRTLQSVTRCQQAALRSPALSHAPILGRKAAAGDVARLPRSAAPPPLSHHVRGNSCGDAPQRRLRQNRRTGPCASVGVGNQWLAPSRRLETLVRRSSSAVEVALSVCAGGE